MAGHRRFFELLELMKDTHIAKNHDYSSEFDPLSNLKMCKDFGIEPYLGVLVRITDKYSRLVQLSNKEAKVKSESYLDTLLDLANYSLLCYILYEEKLAENIEKDSVTSKIIVDDTIPSDEIWITDGKSVGKITGVGSSCMCADLCSPNCINPKR